MTMKIMQLKTHFTVDEASSILQFLEDLKDRLWCAYGDEICRQEYEDAMAQRDDPLLDPDLRDPDFDDHIPF